MNVFALAFLATIFLPVADCGMFLGWRYYGWAGLAISFAIAYILILAYVWERRRK